MGCIHVKKGVILGLRNEDQHTYATILVVVSSFLKKIWLKLI